MLGRYKAEVGFPRGRGDETTVGIPAGEVGGSPPSDWGTMERGCRGDRGPGANPWGSRGTERMIRFVRQTWELRKSRHRE